MTRGGTTWTRRWAPLCVVAGLWLLGAGVTVAWLAADTTPPSWDPSVHLSYSLFYWAYLTRMSPADAWAGIGVTSHYYPPLVHVLGALCFQCFGLLQPVVRGFSTADVATLTNVFLMGPLLFGTYFVAARVYGTRSGLLAAFLVAVYPILAGESRQFLLDYPLTALTAAAMALLLASEGLTHPFWVWPLGLVAGMALWCKWSFAFVFVPPLALVALDGLRRLRAGQPDLTKARLAFNLVVVVAAMGLLAGPWYLSHLPETVRELLTSNQTWRIDLDPAWYSPAGLSYYLGAVTASQLFLPLTLLALFGTWYGWVHRHGYPASLPVYAWVAGGLVVFTLVPNKDPRFTMPLLPGLAVLSASWLEEPAGRKPTDSWRRARGWLLAATVVLGLLELQGVAFGTPLPLRLGPRWAPLWSETAHFTQHPSRLDWPQEEIARDIALFAPPGGKVGVLPNTAHVNFLTVRYFVLRQLLPFLLDSERRVEVLATTHVEAGVEGPATVDTLLADGFDVLLTLEGEQGAHTDLIDATRANLERDKERFLTAYEPAATHLLPGGETVTLWRRRE